MIEEGYSPSASVISPVYRNAASLVELHNRLRQVFNQQNLTYEIIFINDACPENSLSILRELAREDPHVAVLALKENVGQQRAVMQGIYYARGSAVITMDADLQDPPEAIPRLLEKLNEGYAVVFGGRRGKYEDAGRLFTSRLYKTTLHLICGVPKDTGMYMAINRQAVDWLLSFREEKPYIIAMIGCANLSMASIPVHRQSRKDGISTYGSWKRLKLGFGAVAWVAAWKFGLKQKSTTRKAPFSLVSEFVGHRFLEENSLES